MILYLIFYLLVAHAICDFPLQGDVVAKEKNPNSTSELQKHVPWYYWLTAHALMHGGAVALITGSIVLGIAEVICHWIIDYNKCLGKYSIHTDQALHFICKVVWIAFLLVK